MEPRDHYIEGRSVIKTVKALSSDVRLELLSLLGDGEMSLVELVERLKLGKSTVLSHVNILEETGFIKTRYIPGSVGNQKVCRKVYDRLIFNFTPSTQTDRDYIEMSIPVGNYLDFEIYPPCGLATVHNVIKKWDDPDVFSDPERVNASLVWGAYGFVEYKLPLPELPLSKTVLLTSFRLSDYFSKIEILAEISAQGGAFGHEKLVIPPEIDRSQLTDGVSDLTIWLNGVEISTTTVVEYGKGSGGIYTPKWWKGSSHGRLVRLAVSRDGLELDEERLTHTNIENLGLGPDVRLRIGLRSDAKQISGFNIYGASFGNYPQDIIYRLYPR